MTKVMNYHINTNHGEIAFSGETKPEAEAYAIMAGFEIVAPTTTAHFFSYTYEGGGVMPFSGDYVSPSLVTTKIEVAV